jgi:hypothetical protein
MKILITALLLCAASQMIIAQPGRIDPLTGLPIGTPSLQGEPTEELPKFNLDFQGGPVEVFVLHLQDALKKVDENFFINIIVPPEFQETPLPPLKLRNVDVLQLFKALELASQKMVAYNAGSYSFNGIMPQPIQQTGTKRYGFTTTGPITRNSIWHFFAEEPPRVAPVRMVRYFQLGPYLTQFTMDDIGSAIEAGWNLLGEKNTPKLNFHQDTKLLIAAGSAEHLEMISTMLKELSAGLTNTPARAAIEGSTNDSAQAQFQNRLNQAVKKF